MDTVSFLINCIFCSTHIHGAKMELTRQLFDKEIKNTVPCKVQVWGLIWICVPVLKNICTGTYLFGTLLKKID
jgi:hypothetical protein